MGFDVPSIPEFPNGVGSISVASAGSRCIFSAADEIKYREQAFLGRLNTRERQLEHRVKPASKFAIGEFRGGNGEFGWRNLGEKAEEWRAGTRRGGSVGKTGAPSMAEP